MKALPTFEGQAIKYQPFDTQDSLDNSPLEIQDQPPTPNVTVLKVIRLNPNISVTNFWCCMFHSFFMILGGAFTNSLQPLILLDKNYYNISQDESGKIMSLILIVMLVVKLIVSIPYGHCTDKFGRKIMIQYAAINYLLSCLIVPLQTTVFPGLILAKILLANSMSAFHSVPLIADYIADESKGKAAGILATIAGISSILANVILQQLYKSGIPLGTCYLGAGIFTFLAVIFNSFGLKGGRYYISHKIHKPDTTDTSFTSLKNNFKEALSIFKSNGWLLIALVLQITGGSDFFIFFSFMALYVKSLFLNQTETGIPIKAEDQNFNRTTDQVSNVKVSDLNILVKLTAFVCNIIYAYLLDKKKTIIPVIYVALIGSALSFVLLSASKHPDDLSLEIAVSLFGATVPGLFLITNYLNIKNFPIEKRGIMISFSGFVGSIAHFIMASLGGFLYDNWRKDGPFLICALLLGVAMILIARIYFTKLHGKN